MANGPYAGRLFGMSEIPPTPPTDDNEETGSGPGAGGAGNRGERPRKLLRSSKDRMLGGVAGGLAEYFNIDPVLIRIGFAITGLMGIGILTYLALFIFVPEDDGWGNPVQARDRDRLIAGGVIVLLLAAIPGGLFPLASFDWWWGIGAVLFWLALLVGIGYGVYWLVSGGRRDEAATAEQATAETRATPGTQAGGSARTGRSFGHLLLMATLVAGLAVLCAFLAFTSAWGTAVGGGGVIGVIVILSGAMIALAAFKRPMRWLIAPAIALALPAAAVQAADYELEGGYGDRVVRPALLSDIPSDGYRMAAGNLTIDLREADWRPGSEVDLPTRLNFGRISVVVPKNVCVASDIEVWAGGFEVFGDSDSDYRVEYRRTLPEKATPKLNLKSDVDIGWVEVLTQMPTDEWDEHRGLREPNASQPAHCLRAGR